MKNSYFKIKIVKHTPLVFGNKREDMWHKDMVGKIILVKRLPSNGAFYETKSGYTILTTDCGVDISMIKMIAKNLEIKIPRRMLKYMLKHFGHMSGREMKMLLKLCKLATDRQKALNEHLLSMMYGCIAIK